MKTNQYWFQEAVCHSSLVYSLTYHTRDGIWGSEHYTMWQITSEENVVKKNKGNASKVICIHNYITIYKIDGGPNHIYW